MDLFRPPQLDQIELPRRPSQRAPDPISVVGMVQSLFRGVIGLVLLTVFGIAAILLLYTSWKGFWYLKDIIDTYLVR